MLWPVWGVWQAYRGIARDLPRQPLQAGYHAKLRDSIDDAADQLRNAQTFRQAPGVVIVYNNFIPADSSELIRACLGDLTISIDRNTLERGEAFLGQNGILQAGKNPSVSAVAYRRRNGPILSLLNPGARYPIKPSWVAGEVRRVNDNGEVVVA